MISRVSLSSLINLTSRSRHRCHSTESRMTFSVFVALRSSASRSQFVTNLVNDLFKGTLSDDDPPTTAPIGRLADQWEKRITVHSLAWMSWEVSESRHGSVAGVNEGKISCGIFGTFYYGRQRLQLSPRRFVCSFRFVIASIKVLKNTFIKQTRQDFFLTTDSILLAQRWLVS